MRATPKAACGNSIGDRQMLEYARPATAPRPVPHDDAVANHRIFIFSAISIVGLVLGAILIAAVSRLTQNI